MKLHPGDYISHPVERVSFTTSSEGCREGPVAAVQWHEGDVVRKLRTALKWGLTELSQRSGVNSQTIHRIEKGETREPKRATMARIAKAFNISLRELEDAVPRSVTTHRVSEDVQKRLAKGGSR